MSDGPRRVEVGDVVGFRYRIKDEKGVVLATSTELVHCVHGGEQSLPQCVEDDMKGRTCGETFTTTVSNREGVAMRRLTLQKDVGTPIRVQISIVSIRVGLGGLGGDPITANPDLEAELVDLRARLDTKFSDEAAPGGFLETLVDEDFTTARRVGVLRGQHATLVSQLDEIIAQVREDGNAYDHRPALMRLVRSVVRRDEASRDMWIESVNRDYGGEG